MDAIDFATSVAKGLGMELPSVLDVTGWDRLSAGAARLAKELSFPLAGGCDYSTPCPKHPEDFLFRVTRVSGVVSGAVGRWTCQCVATVPATLISA